MAYCLWEGCCITVVQSYEHKPAILFRACMTTQNKSISTISCGKEGLGGGVGGGQKADLVFEKTRWAGDLKNVR